jgi:hypothetical protein
MTLSALIHIFTILLKDTVTRPLYCFVSNSVVLMDFIFFDILECIFWVIWLTIRSSDNSVWDFQNLEWTIALPVSPGLLNGRHYQGASACRRVDHRAYPKKNCVKIAYLLSMALLLHTLPVQIVKLSENNLQWFSRLKCFMMIKLLYCKCSYRSRHKICYYSIYFEPVMA